MSKRYVLLLGVFGLLALGISMVAFNPLASAETTISEAPRPTELPTPQNYQIFTNKELGFQFEYPNGFSQIEVRDERALFATGFVPTGQAEGFTGYNEFDVLVYERNDVSQNLSAWILANTSVYPSDENAEEDTLFVNVTESDLEEVQLGRHRGIHFVSDFVYKQVEYYLISDGAYVYQFVYGIDQSDASMRAVVQQVVISLDLPSEGQ